MVNFFVLTHQFDDTALYNLNQNEDNNQDDEIFIDYAQRYDTSSNIGEMRKVYNEIYNDILSIYEKALEQRKSNNKKDDEADPMDIFTGSGFLSHINKHTMYEEKLLRNLTKSVDIKSVRPADQVNIKFRVILNAIISLDERDQILTTNIFLDHKWIDQRLKWNPQDFNNISSLRIPAPSIWVPDTYVYETMMSDYSGFITPRRENNVIIQYTGQVYWPNPLSRLRTRCTVDVSFFPFDEQICNLTFGSWSHTSSLLNFSILNELPSESTAFEGVDLTLYRENSEWELVYADHFTVESVYNFFYNPDLIEDRLRFKESQNNTENRGNDCTLVKSNDIIEYFDMKSDELKKFNVTRNIQNLITEREFYDTYDFQKMMFIYLIQLYCMQKNESTMKPFIKNKLINVNISVVERCSYDNPIETFHQDVHGIIVKYCAYDNVNSPASSTSTFTDVVYRIRIRRKPLHVLYNNVLPCLMLSVLSLVSFSIPFQQQVQIGISTLISYSVFTLRLADDVPEQSETVPLINLHLTFCMGFTLAAMSWFACVQYMRDSQYIPPLLKRTILCKRIGIWRWIFWKPATNLHRHYHPKAKHITALLTATLIAAPTSDKKQSIHVESSVPMTEKTKKKIREEKKRHQQSKLNKNTSIHILDRKSIINAIKNKNAIDEEMCSDVERIDSSSSKSRKMSVIPKYRPDTMYPNEIEILVRTINRFVLILFCITEIVFNVFLWIIVPVCFTSYYKERAYK
ncbi:hypothetical protein SNEBB_001334 [Seison nebaliae]|nr:hypothetical protein SNEBB_001334 [Seison nebaliae]